MIKRSSTDRELRRFVPWFYGAAVYNLVWGATVAAYPALLADATGLPEENRILLQCVGLFVLVYAPAYWWVARRPTRHAHLVAVGFLGKALGAIGFTAAALSAALPLRFGVTILLNDVIWLPAFWLYLNASARESGGWRALLAG
jgi:hypothetical protein